MPPRKRRSQPDPLPPSGLLDWSHGPHWAWRAEPCRYCDGPPTQLRDSKGKPAHKVCAEAALAARAAEAAEAYEAERLTLSADPPAARPSEDGPQPQ
ncbi:hypothetical protein [Streptomyces sp. G1]|uniref:hypothetical protein n=1 Tax=Streptomyces sp. G1 TaxID=361572 RepID=UPI00202FF687|nr:hypothetical protein [Streptomyces sp. G1]MCM1964903.1 hypothetical protein [Streptomyces sp. G1]